MASNGPKATEVYILVCSITSSVLNQVDYPSLELHTTFIPEAGHVYCVPIGMTKGLEHLALIRCLLILCDIQMHAVLHGISKNAHA